jgi:hypothetical protein
MKKNQIDATVMYGKERLVDIWFTIGILEILVVW